MTAPADASFRPFVIMWSGQLVSLMGSALSNFALGVYAYQLTGSVTTLGLVYALAYLPFFLASPFTGSLVDRWGTHRSLVVSNVAATVVMLTLAGLFATHLFTAWNLYLIVSAISVIGSLQTPAFEAAIPALVPRRRLGRANGMRMLAIAASQLLAPATAGFLLLSIDVSGIIVMDCASYAVALLTLASMRILDAREPNAELRPITVAGLLGDFAETWRHIAARRGLLALLMFSAAVNFCGAFVELLITPLVLAFRSSGSLGTVMSFAGVGMLVASLALSAWGGPRRRIYGMLGFTVLMGAATITGAARPNIPLIAASGFVLLGSSVIVVGCNQILWQTKIERGLLGRTMALMGMAVSAPQLVAYALAGITADQVFGPLVGRHHVRTAGLRLLVGDGPGRSFALLIMVMGVLIVLCAVVGALSPRLRNIDTELPDLDDGPAPVAADLKPAIEVREVVAVPLAVPTAEPAAGSRA